MTAVLAAGPVHLTRHAMRRYRERICPDADEREAAVVLRDATRRMWRADERTHNGECLWCVDRPDMRLVTKHDPAMGMILVTVLAPEQVWDEPAEEAPAPPPPASAALQPPPAPAPCRFTKEERQAHHAAMVAAQMAAAAQRRAERALRNETELRAHAEAKAKRLGPDAATHAKLVADRAAKTAAEVAREARGAEHEANRARRHALGMPTKSERRAARAAGPPQCHGVNALVCVNLLDGYESAWRREEDGARLCRECDAALDRDHAALSAATAEAAE